MAPQYEFSTAVEDYAKAIYALEERDGTVTTNALACRLGVTPASASAMVRKLHELGLVTHEPYRGVKLTESGRRLALEIVRHHRLLELYLAESLGIPWDRVHAEAEVLEHHSRATSSRRGSPPSSATRRTTRTATRSRPPTSRSPQDDTQSLVALEPGDTATLARV